MLSLGDPNLTTKTVSAMIPIVVLLLVRAKTSSARYRCTKGLHINSCQILKYHCASYLLLDIHFNFTYVFHISPPPTAYKDALPFGPLTTTKGQCDCEPPRFVACQDVFRCQSSKPKQLSMSDFPEIPKDTEI